MGVSKQDNNSMMHHRDEIMAYTYSCESVRYKMQHSFALGRLDSYEACRDKLLIKMSKLSKPLRASMCNAAMHKYQPSQEFQL